MDDGAAPDLAAALARLRRALRTDDLGARRSAVGMLALTVALHRAVTQGDEGDDHGRRRACLRGEAPHARDQLDLVEMLEALATTPVDGTLSDSDFKRAKEKLLWGA